MKIAKKLSRMMTSAAALVVSIILFSCAETTIIEPQASKTVQRKTSELTFLKSNTFRLFKVFTASQLITAADGGTIEIGDDSSGYSKLVFNPGDVSQDLNVDFNWDSQNFEAELSPHGSQFNNPVLLRLSYKDADLTGVNEDSLKIWYYNENNDIWELTGQVVNKDQKYVEGTTTHFSRFAIGGE